MFVYNYKLKEPINSLSIITSHIMYNQQRYFHYLYTTFNIDATILNYQRFVCAKKYLALALAAEGPYKSNTEKPQTASQWPRTETRTGHSGIFP